MSTRSTIEHPSRAPEWRILPRRAMTSGLYAEAVALCSEAYEEDYAALMDEHGAASVHLLGFEARTLVCHVLWVPWWVAAGPLPAMAAAVVEALATKPGHQGRGLASLVMRRLVQEIERSGFDVGVLWPSDVGWYERLGWERWRGPVSQRFDACVEPLRDDEVMIHRLPRTPVLDLHADLVVTEAHCLACDQGNWFGPQSKRGRDPRR